MNDCEQFDKLVLSGSIIEHTYGWYVPSYTPPSKLDTSSLALRRSQKAFYNSGGTLPLTDAVASSLARSRASVRRLIFLNSYRYRDKFGGVIPPKFLTLTFRENIVSVSEANKFLTRFVRSVNNRFSEFLPEGLKYVVVVEFQSRGAVHYHLVLFNFPFVDKVFSKLRDFWPNQFYLKTISRQFGVSGISNYLVKYISKGGADGRLFGQKRYFVSRGLARPEVSRDFLFNFMAVGSVASSRVSSRRFNVRFASGRSDLYLLPEGGSLNKKLVNGLLKL